MKITFDDGTTEQPYEDEPLGSGAQGEIYRSRSGQSAVKLYYPSPDKDEDERYIKHIKKLISNEYNPTSGKDNRYWREFFAWPEKLVKQPRTGYRMRYVSSLKTLDHYILGKAYQKLKPEERGWFIGRVGIALKLAIAANRLAQYGLCYSDFSAKNILVDPFRSRMVLVDCDSLTVPGVLPATIGGTSNFRAPEIMTGDDTTPSVESDRHALAVIFYYWLLLWHPLMGDQIFYKDDIIKNDLLRFGKRSLYIEHPTNKANRASGQIFKAHMLGQELEKLFQRAFVTGLHSPKDRPQPFEWQRAFYHMYDHLVPCPSLHCEWRSFVAPHAPNALEPHSFLLACPWCRTALKEPGTIPYMHLLSYQSESDTYEQPQSNDHHYIVVWSQRLLHSWHINKKIEEKALADPDYIPDIIPVALFIYDENTRQWYLRNLKLRNMQYKEGNRDWTPCGINGQIPLTSETVIQFGPGSEYFRAHIVMNKVI